MEVRGAGAGETRDMSACRLAQIAVDAGLRIMAIRQQGCSPSYKADASPVTAADLAAEALILDRLAEAFPAIPVVAEEQAAAGCAEPFTERAILVDPLDGTREFVAGRPEFTVNLALVERGVPVAGAIYAPALGRLWFGGETAATAEVEPGERLDRAETRPISVRPPPRSGIVALVSRSHRDERTEAFLGRLPVVERRPLGSSLKFCLIAQGEADVYPRFGTTCEWDTAAGHAILAAAGGTVTAPDGSPLRYGKGSFRHGAFVACGGLRVGPDGITGSGA